MNPILRQQIPTAKLRGIKSSLALLTALGLFSTAASADVTYQYFRYTPTQLRNNSAANSVQLSEFQFIDNGSPIDVAGVIVTAPGGNSPGGEGPTNLTDLSTGSKWLDFSKVTPVVFQFTAPVTIDTYNFATAGDAQERDPVSWTFEGSANGSSWVLLDVKTNFATTTNRETYQSGFSLDGSGIGFFTRSLAIVANGQPTQLSWSTLNANPGGVSIAPGVGVVANTGSISTVPPASADTTYTLTATSFSGPASATTFVRSVPETTVNYRYVRFTPTKLRSDATAFGVQLSEFTLLSGITLIPAAGATNPGGSSVGGEGPEKAIDGDANSKWLDSNRRPLIVDLGSTVPITGYSFVTGNDFSDRDPIQWSLQGSNNGTSWAIIEQVDFDFPMPDARNTASQAIPLPGVIFNPIISLFVGDAPKLIAGQPLVLTWEVPGATSVTIDNEVGTFSASSGSVTLNPVTGTTYTLTATGPVGTTPVSGTFTTTIISPAITTINYTNFDNAGEELALLGDSSTVNDFGNVPLPGNFARLRLNPDLQFKSGSTWFRKRINVATGFQTFFDFQINSANDSQGADGMAFMIQDNPAGTGILVSGEVERGLPTKSLNVRINSFEGGERTGAVVQVLSGTDVLGSVNLFDFPALVPALREGTDLTQTGGDDAPYQVRMDYVPGDLDLYFNGVLIFDSINVDLVAIGAVNAAGKGYAGFAGRTGFFFESHDITRWLLTEGAPSGGVAPLVLKSHSFNFVTDQLSLTWGSTDTKTYRITTSTNLAPPWLTIASGIAGAPAQNETSFTVNFTQSAKAFFRVEQE